MFGVTMETNKGKRVTTYTVRWRDPISGESRQETLPKKGMADSFAAKKIGELAGVRHGLASGDGRMTVGEFYADTFLPLRGDEVSDGTVGGWERRWSPTKAAPSAWHVCRWAQWRLEQVTPEVIKRWHVEMRKAGAPDATVYMAHDLLSTILGYAKTLSYVPVNHARELRPKYRPKRAKAPWSPAEVERVREVFLSKAAVKAAKGGRGGVAHWSEARLDDYRFRRQRDAMLVALLAYAGLRPGEALALVWGDISERTIHVQRTLPGVDEEPGVDLDNGLTKTGKDRTVKPLPAFLRRLLVEWRMRCPGSGSATAPVLPVSRQGEHFDYNQWICWRRGWRGALEAAGLEYVKPYHLRHSCISMWIAAGWDIATVANRAGHSIEVCARVYAHAFADRDPARPLDIEAEFSAARASSAGTPRVELASVRSDRGRA